MITYIFGGKIISNRVFDNKTTPIKSIDKGGISKNLEQISANEEIQISTLLDPQIVFKYEPSLTTIDKFDNISIPSGYVFISG